MTFFIYFSLIGEGLIGTIGFLFLFVPWSIARWASIFMFISEFPFLANKQIVIILSDTGGISYATFGVPLLFVTPFFYTASILTFIAFQNLFVSIDRDYFGRKKK